MDRTLRNHGGASPEASASTRKRKAAFCAMGDSFLRQLCNESLSDGERVDYAADAAYMYAMSDPGHADDSDPIGVDGLDGAGLPAPCVQATGAAPPSSPTLGLYIPENAGSRLARLIAFVEQCRTAARAG